MADTLRISQVLPTVKCSQCSLPVPLTDLGTHQCAPVPAVPKLALSIPKNNSNLLPSRFQSPTSAIKPLSPVENINRPRASSSLNRINPNAIPPQSPRFQRPSPSPSPLSRRDTNGSISAGTNRARAPSNASTNPSLALNSPQITSRPRQGSYTSINTNTQPSLNSPIISSPRQPQGSYGNSSSGVPQNLQVVQTPPTRLEPLVSGGEAGMAGVGRRGFAAAARAAMFASSPTVGPSSLRGPPLQDNRQDESVNWQPQVFGPSGSTATSSIKTLDQNSIGMDGRRANAPRLLDTGLATSQSRLNSHTPTPPLTPNSGGSTHSHSPSSMSPQTPFARSPSPSMNAAEQTSNPSITNATSESPTGLSRLAFFDKIRAKLPTTGPFPLSLANNDDTHNPNTTNNTPTTATAYNSVTPVPRESTFSRQARDRTSLESTSSASSASSYAASVAAENERSSHMSTVSTATSVGLQGFGTRIISSSSQTHTRYMSSESASEYGGLAYADSGNESETSSIRSSASSRRKLPPIPSFPPSILRANSDTAPLQSRSQFPNESRPAILKSSGSMSSLSSRSSIDDDGESGRRPVPKRSATADIPIPNRTSSQSSMKEDSSLTRSNSERIAQALGLARTPPSSYSRLGGPGMGNRSRQGSVASTRSKSSSISGGPKDSPLPDSTNISHKPSSSRPTNISFSATTPSRGVAERSNTVPVIKSQPATSSPPDTESAGRNATAVARSKTTLEKESVRETSNIAAKTHPGSEKRSRTTPQQQRKVRQCVRCDKKIDDGRWVQVDGGGILCEQCWKNMYLPKCRRCNLVIEKQAVSSSDGQLKGKYHKSCFNCYTCHKSFPDKTFYVHQGKPYCAFHYHEANESLCAAALCGQPIEGACAVSHTGDRYHPEHLLCEHPGYPKCTKTLLNEYWEVDGRMLCERHQRRAFENDNDWVPSAKALKRTTRFIDLAGGADSLR